MYAFLPDILLIVICGFTCLYCWILSKRLKKLQSLDSGLGASILSLTEAIAKTNTAALEARQSTQISVETLQSLLGSVDAAIPQVEAKVESLYNARKAAENKSNELENIIAAEIDPALHSARQSSLSLLQMVKEVKSYEQRANALKANTTKQGEAA